MSYEERGLRNACLDKLQISFWDYWFAGLKMFLYFNIDAEH